MLHTNIEEIRINQYYASKIRSDYPKELDKDSEPKTRQSNIRSEVLFTKIMDRIAPNQATSLIPPNCRFMKTYSDHTMVIIEEQPAMRSIRVRMDMYDERESLKSKGQWEEFGYKKFFEENSNPYTFMLAMPYVIHVLLFTNDNKFHEGSIYFRPKSLLGMGDQLYIAPLLNVSANMGICYGDEVYRDLPTSLARASDYVVRNFWSSTFNPDYIDNYYKYKHIAGVCNYFTWQYYSSTNPMFIYNVDWIPYSKNISEVIAYKENRSKLKKQDLGFHTLNDLFKKAIKTGQSIVPPRTRLEKPLLYDICNGWNAEPNLLLHVGDPLNYSRGRVAYIDSFIGVQGALQPYFIRLQVDDKIVTLKLNSKIKRFIARKVKEIRYEAQLETPNGIIIKAGDVISIKSKLGTETYKKVHYIRKAIDNKIEVRMGSEFFFADTFDWTKVKKIDLEKPIIDGQTIDFSTTYKYMMTDYYNPAPVVRVADVTFDEISASTNGNLVANFSNINTSEIHKVNLSSTKHRDRKLYPVDEMQELPYVYFIGRSLKTTQNRLSGNIVRSYKHKDIGIVINNKDRLHVPCYTDTIKEFISTDGKHFHAESYNCNIDFHIGDKVIVTDWRHPLSILQIKTIEGFILNDRDHTIDFALVDKHGKITNQKYVNCDRGLILVGKIRKVTNKIDRVTAGTKIIAKESSISCFPKKDVNIIVAFIIDTGGEPLVLCSNGHTLWYTDMLEKFERVSKKAKRW